MPIVLYAANPTNIYRPATFLPSRIVCQGFVLPAICLFTLQGRHTQSVPCSQRRKEVRPRWLASPDFSSKILVVNKLFPGDYRLGEERFEIDGGAGSIRQV